MGEPLLTIKNLCVRFGGLTAVSHLDLHVEAGTISSIIGPNGAGKTTVFNVITGIYEPTEGQVLLDGRDLRRPRTWKVLAMSLLVGLLAGTCLMLVALDVDALWRSTIKRSNGDPTQPFSYAAAAGEFWRYVRGTPSVEYRRQRDWAVIMPSGQVLALAATKDDAQQVRDYLSRGGGYTAEIALANDENGQYFVAIADSRRLATLTDDLAAVLEVISDERRATRRSAFLGFVLGLLFGAAGNFAVWSRSRRTPDVISLGGIARTFQNIRLFSSMTVAENVLSGRDRSYRAGFLGMLFHTPKMKRDQQEQCAVALELLKFVGLAGKAQHVAGSLAYGEQRRLEIARAMATGPRLLLLDEPAAGMNPAETTELAGLIRRIRDRGITVLLIEHHMNVVMRISDRVAVLDHGEKIADATPAEVRSNPKVIQAYLGKDEHAA